MRCPDLSRGATNDADADAAVANTAVANNANADTADTAVAVDLRQSTLLHLQIYTYMDSNEAHEFFLLLGKPKNGIII